MIPPPPFANSTETSRVCLHLRQLGLRQAMITGISIGTQARTKRNVAAFLKLHMRMSLQV